MKYRIEQKYLCDQKDYVLLKSRIENLMHLDQNANNPSYQIRSVYFDDMYNSKFYENEDGVDDRTKYRIRIYDASSDLIRFEAKEKLRGYTRKKSFKLDKKEFHNFMREDFEFTISDNALKNTIMIKKMNDRLAPSVIVEYNREAYTYEVGNVRITFDSDISVSNEFDKFFEKEISTLAVLEEGQFILEVKYDEFLPQYIAEALEINNLQQTTFSKFYLGKIKMGYQEGVYKNEY